MALVFGIGRLEAAPDALARLPKPKHRPISRCRDGPGLRTLAIAIRSDLNSSRVPAELASDPHMWHSPPIAAPVAWESG